MDQKTEAMFTMQLAAFGLALKSLIATHPDGEAFAAAFREYVAQFQSAPAILEAGHGARDHFRAVCESLLAEIPQSKGQG